MGFVCGCVCRWHMLFLCMLLLQNKLLVTFCESLLVSKYKQILRSLHGKELGTPSVLLCLLDIFLMYTRNLIKHEDPPKNLLNLKISTGLFMTTVDQFPY